MFDILEIKLKAEKESDDSVLDLWEEFFSQNTDLNVNEAIKRKLMASASFYEYVQDGDEDDLKKCGMTDEKTLQLFDYRAGKFYRENMGN